MTQVTQAGASSGVGALLLHGGEERAKLQDRALSFSAYKVAKCVAYTKLVGVEVCITLVYLLKAQQGGTHR